MAMRNDSRVEEEVEVEENFGPQLLSRLEVGDDPSTSLITSK